MAYYTVRKEGEPGNEASIHHYSVASVPGLPHSVRVLVMRRQQLKRARNGGGLEPRLIILFSWLGLDQQMCAQYYECMLHLEKAVIL